MAIALAGIAPNSTPSGLRAIVLKEGILKFEQIPLSAKFIQLQKEKITDVEIRHLSFCFHN
ncbi:MAG: hypothetical protein WKG06_03995 [Segetibacter sp.]